jgi:hypothetical protein
MSVYYVGTNGADGSCFGKTTSDKIAFFGTTPIDQEAAIADATDAATAITQLNSVIGVLENYGLIAS